MINDTTICVRGWAGSDPLVFREEPTEPGAYAKVTGVTMNVGVTPRYFDRQAGEFKDGTTTWFSVRCSGTLARNVAMTVHRGAPLLVRGAFSAREYTDKNGVHRVAQQITADSVAIDLNSMVATYAKSPTMQSHLSGRSPEPRDTDGHSAGAGELTQSDHINSADESAEPLGGCGLNNIVDDDFDNAKAVGVLAHV